MLTEFVVVDIPVRVESSDPLVHEVLNLAWGPALGAASRPVSRGESIEYLIADGALWREGTVISRCSSHAMLCRMIEGDLLQEVATRYAGLTLLHAAALILDETLFLFVGESGGGKSSMSRACIRVGARYLTDDCLVLGDGVLRGVPRTIQFDGIEAERPTPHVQGCDVVSYPGLSSNDVERRVPLFVGDYSYAGPVQLPSKRTILVHLEPAWGYIGASLGPFGGRFGPQDGSRMQIPEENHCV